jgi:hypothetical protein
MERMTRQQEAELLQAVREAAHHYVDGDSPVDAVVKVARARGLPREHVARVVEAFNVNTTLSHFQRTTGADKAAEFPTADLDAVFNKLYPETVDSPAKTAALTWAPGPEAYMETQDFMAAELPRFTNKRASRGMSEAQALETIMEDYRADVAELDREESMLGQCGERLQAAVNKYASYFTAVGADSPASIDDPGLRAVVVERVPQLRKQGLASLGSPEPALRAAVAARDQYIKQAGVVAGLRTELEAAANRVTARVAVVKTANLFTGAAGGLASALVADATELTGPKQRAAVAAQVASPEMMAERKSIRTRAMLKTMLEDDEVLRHAPKDEVVTAFNSISSVAPSVASSPMLLSGWMRRVIESRGLDPFDMHELVRMEKTLRGVERTGRGQDNDED